MAEKVLADNHFKCTHFDYCCKSHSGIFYKGQLHHVGRHYDLAIDDKPLRIVVVGMAYGGAPAKVTMEDRYHVVVVETGEKKGFGADSGLPARNPHMRGTTSLLRLLFGIPLGTDHAREYIQINNNEKCHIFDAFALVNYLLCSAIAKDGGTTDKSTPTMHQNCRGHFRQALMRLEPNVVVVQGIGFWPLVSESFDTVEPIDRNNVLYRVELGGRKFLTAAFTHPSARNTEYGWGINDHTPYLLKTVVPTVKKIREEILGSTS